jgi:hypothetical protein
MKKLRRFAPLLVATGLGCGVPDSAITSGSLSTKITTEYQSDFGEIVATSRFDEDGNVITKLVDAKGEPAGTMTTRRDGSAEWASASRQTTLRVQLPYSSTLASSNAQAEEFWREVQERVKTSPASNASNSQSTELSSGIPSPSAPSTATAVGESCLCLDWEWVCSPTLICHTECVTTQTCYDFMCNDVPCQVCDPPVTTCNKVCDLVDKCYNVCYLWQCGPYE